MGVKGLRSVLKDVYKEKILRMRKPWRNLWLKSGRLILDRDSFFKCEGNYERARGVILRYLHIITIVVEELLINLTRNLKDEIVTF